jgi:hypothetical protein
LPELFPTAVLATGQGFGFSFGGLIGDEGALLKASLMAALGGSFAKAGSVVVIVYLIGIFVVWLGPETKGKPLPD